MKRRWAPPYSPKIVREGTLNFNLKSKEANEDQAGDVLKKDWKNDAKIRFTCENELNENFHYLV